MARADVVPGILVVQSGSKAEIVENARKQASHPDAPKTPGNPAFDRAKFENSLVSLQMVEVVSQEVDEDGRLTPISWSLADPVFRSAIEDKLISGSIDNPNIAEVQAAMPKLRVGYVLVFSAFVSDGEVWTSAKLYKAQKEIWKDEVRSWQSQTQALFDGDNARRSIARTWIQILGNGPLKDLPQRKRADTPQAHQGTVLQNTAVAPPAPPDNRQLLVDSAKLMAARQVAEAVNLLRDAVDAAPADMERRRALISALLEIGEPELAAREARRAASLSPEVVELWVLAARSWLATGKETEAEQDLNEAVSRDPDGTETRLLLGEIQLSQKRFPLAIEHLTKVLEKDASAYVLRLRAFCFASVGDAEAVRRDLDAAGTSKKAETDVELQRRLRTSIRGTMDLLGTHGTELRTLIQRARLAPKDPENKTGHAALETKLTCLNVYLAELEARASHRNSHERLVLALKLLAQSLTDLSGSLESVDEDALTEATINLGEGLKALEAAKAEYAKEIA